MHARYKPRRNDSLAPVSLSSSTPHATFTPPAAHHLQLSTSRSTNIVPRALARYAGGVAPPHVTIPLRHDFLRHPILMRPSQLWGMPRNAEFDVLCVLLYEQPSDEQAELTGTGAVRRMRQRHLLCAGMSGDLLLLEVHESSEHVFFSANVVAPRQIMLVENLTYLRYEKHLHLHVATTNALTLFKPKGAAPLSALPTSAPAPVLALHTAVTHPTAAHLQTWVSEPLTASLYERIQAFSQRIVTGTWNGGQTNTFNQHDFHTVSTHHRQRGEQEAIGSKTAHMLLWMCGCWRVGVDVFSAWQHCGVGRYFCSGVQRSVSADALVRGSCC